MSTAFLSLTLISVLIYKYHVKPGMLFPTHLLEGFHQFLFIIVIGNALDCGEGFSAVPLLDPYMDVVLSPSRK